MNRMGGKGAAFALAACLLFCAFSTAGAQTQAVDTAGRFRLEPALFLGFGAEDLEVGTTTGGESVSISGGGGIGAGMTWGYGLSRTFDIDLTLGLQESTLTPSVENAEGSFPRTFLLATLKYKLPVQDRFQIKFGAGIGFYHPGKLDVDTAAALNGGHDVIRYDDATGFHVTGELETFIQPAVSITFGGKYYHVVYRETSGTHNGAPVFFTADDVRNLDGSGFDLFAALGVYLSMQERLRFRAMRGAPLPAFLPSFLFPSIPLLLYFCRSISYNVF